MFRISLTALQPYTNLTKPLTLLNRGNINAATPFPGPVVNSGILISNSIPVVVPSMADVAESVSGFRPINRDNCVSTAIQGVTTSSILLDIYGLSGFGYIIGCGREMWISIRKCGTLGVVLEGVGIEEIAAQSQPGS